MWQISDGGLFSNVNIISKIYFFFGKFHIFFINFITTFDLWNSWTFFLMWNFQSHRLTNFTIFYTFFSIFYFIQLKHWIRFWLEKTSKILYIFCGKVCWNFRKNWVEGFVKNVTKITTRMFKSNRKFSKKKKCSHFSKTIFLQF